MKMPSDSGNVVGAILRETHVKTHKLQQTCSRLVAMLFQQLVIYCPAIQNQNE
jgi:hypothetical protein